MYIENHMVVHQPKGEKVQIRKSFPCKLCDKVYNHYTNLHNHKQNEDLQTKLNINMTIKANVIIHHLCDYLQRHKTFILRSTDQSIEAIHSKLDQYLKTHGYFSQITNGENFLIVYVL